MAYPFTPTTQPPLKNYHVNSFNFNEWCKYDGVVWGYHLGEDVNCRAGTKVLASGRGHVVYAALHPGTRKKRNWGNIIIVAHKNPRTRKNFFTLYGHLGYRLVRKGQRVEVGQVLGTVGRANSAENGFWESHLHFSVYIGPWKGKVLAGYWKKGMKRTKRSFWRKPSSFISSYK